MDDKLEKPNYYTNTGHERLIVAECWLHARDFYLIETSHNLIKELLRLTLQVSKLVLGGLSNPIRSPGQ